MNTTTTVTSKGQITLPKPVRDKLGISQGEKIDIFPILNGFVGKPHRKSKVLELIGDLKHLDKGEPLTEIRKKAQAAAAREIVTKLNPNSK